MKKKTQDRFEEKRENEVLKNEEGYKLSTIENLKTRIKLAFTSMKENNGLTMKIIAGAGLLTAASTVLVACDFGKDDENDSNDNNNNNENNNGGTINPGDGEENPDKDPEKPTEPEPGPPVDPGEPENPDKPVDPTPDEDKELDISGFSDTLSEWNETQVANLISGFTSMYGQELFTEQRGGGALYNGRDFSIVGLQLDENTNSLNTLIKYYASSDTEKNYRLAQKTVNFDNDIQITSYLKKVSAYNSLTNSEKDKYKAPNKEQVTMEKSELYLSVNLQRNEELDSTRMDDFGDILTSFDKVGTINHVFYAKNSQSSAVDNFGDGIRWSASALVLNENNQLQSVNFYMRLANNSPFNSPEMIFEFKNWKENGLVEGKDFDFGSISITSDKTFGGKNAIFQLPPLYENQNTKDYERE